MAWESRNGVGRYYTRSKRVNGRVVREYIGTGPLAELIAAQDAGNRAEREQERQAWNAEREGLEALESSVNRFAGTLCRSSQPCCSSTLATTDITEGGGGNGVSENETLDDGFEKTMRELVRRAQDGDRSVMPAVHKLLDEVPVVVEQLGDLAEIARDNLLKLSSDGNLLRREAQSRWMKDLAQRIAGPDPSILESLLAEQIVIAGMQLHIFEAVFAQRDDTPLRVGDYLQRCIDRAQRRYLQAIKTLAQIRKLGLPALQVNIAAEGGKQVNVASGSLD